MIKTLFEIFLISLMSKAHLLNKPYCTTTIFSMHYTICKKNCHKETHSNFYIIIFKMIFPSFVKVLLHGPFNCWKIHDKYKSKNVMFRQTWHLQTTRIVTNKEIYFSRHFCGSFVDVFSLSENKQYYIEQPFHVDNHHMNRHILERFFFFIKLLTKYYI